MGNGIVVTNFFRVQDRETFKKFLRRWQLGMTQRDADFVGFTASGSAGIPRKYYDEDLGVLLQGDIVEELQALLIPDEIAIIVENTMIPERHILRSVAIAVMPGQKPIRLSLSEIYERIAREWVMPPFVKVPWLP